MFGLIANVNGDRVIRDGAKVFVTDPNGGGEAWEVNGLSLGGRRVTKYVRLKRMSNFRVAFIPENIRHLVRNKFETRELAEVYFNCAK